MSSTLNFAIDGDHPLVYQIRIKGQLGPHWTDWFEGLSIREVDNSETLLTGPITDQAALYGVLRKVRDLGLPLLAVNRVPPHEADMSKARE